MALYGMAPQGATPIAEPQASPFAPQRSATMPFSGHRSVQPTMGGLSPIPQAAVAPSPSYSPAALPPSTAFAPSPQPQRVSMVGPPGAAAGLSGPRPNHESVDFTTLMAGEALAGHVCRAERADRDAVGIWELAYLRVLCFASCTILVQNVVFGAHCVPGLATELAFCMLLMLAC